MDRWEMRMAVVVTGAAGFLARALVAATVPAAPARPAYDPQPALVAG